MFQSPHLTRSLIRTPNGPTPVFLSLSYTDPKTIALTNNETYDEIYNELKREVHLNITKRV
jgi:hypothetical protein